MSSTRTLAWPLIAAVVLSSATRARAEGPSSDALAVRVRPSTLGVWDRPGGQVVAEVTGGQRFALLKREADWVLIQFGARTAWLAEGYTEPAEADLVEVTASALNVRAGPGVGFAWRGTTTAHQRHVVLERRGGWLRIQYGPYDGWVSGRWVRDITPPPPPSQPPSGAGIVGVLTGKPHDDTGSAAGSNSGEPSSSGASGGTTSGAGGQGGTTSLPASAPKPGSSSSAAAQVPTWTASQPRRWRYIVIHHTESPTGNAASIDHYHRNVKKWANGLAYHFVIGNGRGAGDGEVQVGGRWTRQIPGAHAGVTEYNQRGVGIVLVGNFHQGLPSAAQLDAVRGLCRALMARFNIPPERVLRHRDFRDTDCPGRFPFEAFVESLR